MQFLWDRFVDCITVIWLVVFFTGIANPGIIPDGVEPGLLSVFVVDLLVKYRRVGKLRTFIRRHWSDILMVIPYFRILRLLRVIRIIRAAKIAKVRRFPGLKALEAFRRKSTRIAKEIVKIKER